MDPWDSGAEDNADGGDPWDSNDEGEGCESLHDERDNEPDMPLTWSDVGSSDDDVDPKRHGREKLVHLFGDFLKQMYLDGPISARVLCTICFYCSLLGIGGIIRRLGLKPNSPGGHPSRKVKRVFKIKKDDTRIYWMRLPGHSKSCLSRVCHNLPTNPPHESIDREFKAKPEMVDVLTAAVRDGELPPTYMEHPIAKRSNYTAIPCALYVDGLPTTKTDGVISFRVVNLLTQMHHVCVNIRKSRLCRCGCRGWCSIYPVMVFLLWSFYCGADGVYAVDRHDGSEWGAEDPARKDLALQKMACVFCICLLVLFSRCYSLSSEHIMKLL